MLASANVSVPVPTCVAVTAAVEKGTALNAGPCVWNSEPVNTPDVVWFAVIVSHHPLPVAS